MDLPLNALTKKALLTLNCIFCQFNFKWYPNSTKEFYCWTGFGQKAIISNCSKRSVLTDFTVPTIKRIRGSSATFAVIIKIKWHNIAEKEMSFSKRNLKTVTVEHSNRGETHFVMFSWTNYKPQAAPKKWQPDQCLIELAVSAIHLLRK